MSPRSRAVINGDHHIIDIEKGQFLHGIQAVKGSKGQIHCGLNAEKGNIEKKVSEVSLSKYEPCKKHG